MEWESIATQEDTTSLDKCVSHSVLSDSSRPHQLQPARLLRPWNSLGKNTGVSCHSLLQGNLPDPGMEPRFLALQADSLSSEPPKGIPPPWPKNEVKSLSHVQLFVTPWTIAYRFLHPWDFPGKSTRMGCHFLLQGIFPIQGLNPGSPSLAKEPLKYPQTLQEPNGAVFFSGCTEPWTSSIPHKER